MNKATDVYVLVRTEDYEGDVILSLHRTLPGAIEAAEKEAEESTLGYRRIAGTSPPKWDSGWDTHLEIYTLDLVD